MFTVCGLLYGNHLELASRVLESISSTWLVGEIRLGLNEVSSDTFDFVCQWAAKKSKNTKVSLYQPDNGANVGKYPLMLRMFSDITTDKIMWFDDDSYLENSNEAWWKAVHVQSKPYAVFGSLHRIRQRGKQYMAIPSQPWYTGKPVDSRHLYRFATGGWWIGDVSFLKKWNYPFPQLRHNGGDSILGELVRQQDAKLGSVSPELAKCHCEACLKNKTRPGTSKVHINVGGRAGRRGIGVTGENYVFSNGNAFPALSHQEFNVKIFHYG